MDKKELLANIKALFPTCHTEWDSAKDMPPAPWTSWLDRKPCQIAADNGVYYLADNRIGLELYVTKRDLTSESKLEKLLMETKDVYFEKDEKMWIKELSLYLVPYEITIT